MESVFFAPHWYALYIRSRFEKRTDAELQEKGIESFLPLIEEVHVWSDRKKKVLEPLFRGYLFVKTNLRNKVDILQAEGVVRFVSIKNTPSPIPEDQINWVRIVAKRPDAIRREDCIAIGENVRVSAGPFKGVEGFVIKVKDSTRVLVCLSSIAQAVSVEVAPEFLETVVEPRSIAVGVL